MSDIFNHQFDAMMDRDEYCGFWVGNRGGHRSPSDPLYYHRKIKFEKIVSKTDKSYLFSIEGLGDVWVPKKICRHMSMSESSVYIHSGTFTSICRDFRNQDIGDDFNE